MTKAQSEVYVGVRNPTTGKFEFGGLSVCHGTQTGRVSGAARQHPVAPRSRDLPVFIQSCDSEGGSL